MVTVGDVVVAAPAVVVGAGEIVSGEVVSGEVVSGEVASGEVVPVGAAVPVVPVVGSVVTAGEAGGLVQAVTSSTITTANQPRRFRVPDIVIFKRQSINS
jgi:hypothetical protein